MLREIGQRWANFNVLHRGACGNLSIFKWSFQSIDYAFLFGAFVLVGGASSGCMVILIVSGINPITMQRIMYKYGI